MPDVPLRDSAVALTDGGELVFLDISRTAFGLFFRCAMEWCHVRLARRIGALGATSEAEVRARHAGDRLAARLREGGFAAAEIAGLLDRHRHDASADPDWW